METKKKSKKKETVAAAPIGTTTADAAKFGLIYMLVNKINSKIYIGQTTTSIEYRLRKHKQNSKRIGVKGIGGAIKKYGIENFNTVILENNIDISLLDQMEMHYISEYQSTNIDIGYNISIGGNVPRGIIPWNKGLKGLLKSDKKNLTYEQIYGNERAQEIKSKLIESHKGNVAWNKDMKMGPSWNKGIPMNLGTKEKMIQTKIKDKDPIYHFDDNGAVIGIYRSLKDAVDNTGCAKSSIARSLNNQVKNGKFKRIKKEI